MSKKLGLGQKIVLVVGFFLMIGLAGCNTKELCLYPG